MNKQRNRIGLGILIVLVLGAMVHGVYADGYRNPPPTAEGIAKSGVNMVFVDDASAIFYNPANLSLQTNASLVAGVTMARTENTYVNPLAGVPFESDGDWNYLPNLYYSQPVGDNGLAFGLGITTPYGQGISWDQSDFASFVGVDPGQSPMIAYEASIMLINFNPTVAFKAHDSVYVGAGVDIVSSQMELKALLDSAVLGLPPGAMFDSEGEGDGWGVGANVGVTWDVAEGQRLALTYRSQVKVDYEGDFKLNGVTTGDLEATVKYPNTVTAGYGVQLSEKIQVEAMVEWLQWSVNDTQPLTAAGIPADQVNNWDDTVTFGLGGSWAAADSLVFRTGYAFIPSPIPDATVTHLLADEDRHALSFGVGYAFGSHLVDLAYTFSIYDDRDSTPSGAYEVDSNLIGMTYSYSF